MGREQRRPSHGLDVDRRAALVYVHAIMCCLGHQHVATVHAVAITQHRKMNVIIKHANRILVWDGHLEGKFCWQTNINIGIFNNKTIFMLCRNIYTV